MTLPPPLRTEALLSKKHRVLLVCLMAVLALLAGSPAQQASAEPSTTPTESTNPQPSTSPSTLEPTATETDEPTESPPASSKKPEPTVALPPPPPNAKNITVSRGKDGKTLRSFMTPKQDPRARSGPLDCSTGRFHVCETLPEEFRFEVILNGKVTVSYAYAYKIEGYLQSASNPDRNIVLNLYWEGRTIVAGQDSSYIRVRPNLQGHDGLNDVPFATFSHPNNGSRGAKSIRTNVSASVTNTQVYRFQLRADRIDGIGSGTTESEHTLLRCDNAAEVDSTMGCANVHWTPTYTFSSADFPGVVANIVAGQSKFNNVGNPSGEALIRVTGEELRRNRSLACSPGRIAEELPPKPSNMVDPSCDEYPFAGSKQGGVDTTLRWVPQLENSAQGNALQKLHRNNRVMAGDWFYVIPSPI